MVPKGFPEPLEKEVTKEGFAETALEDPEGILREARPHWLQYLGQWFDAMQRCA